MSIYSTIMMLCLSTITANAQTEKLRVKDAPATGVSSLQSPRNSAPAQVYGQIRIEGMQYFTEVPEQPQLTYSQFLSGRISAVKETSWIDFAGDVSGGTYFARGQTHVVVHEAYMASHGNTDFKVFAGRKKKDWSDLDHRWNLGLFQPTFAIDALRPDEQGLSGFFFDYSRAKWEVLGFVTPLFIPNIGPEIREEGGGLVYSSRWGRAPSRDYDFNNRINTIQYSLDVDTSKLINNGGAGMMIRGGNKASGPWTVASAGYMPVNDVILKRQNFKTIDADIVPVKVSPDITYHSIYAFDMGYTFTNVKTSLSYLYDNPQEKRPEEGWSIQKLEPISAYSAAVDFAIDNLWSRTLAFQVEYLKVDGGGIVDILSDGRADDFTFFDQRLKFTNALSFRVEGQLASIFRRALVTRFKYLYDYDQRGSVLNTEFLYYPGQKWAVLVGGDILGVQDENYNSSRFINQFRANDRFYGGLTYVF